MNKYNFIVDWTSGSINDNIIKYLKDNDIKYYYNQYFVLFADIYGIGQYFKFVHEKINDSTYGITAIAL